VAEDATFTGRGFCIVTGGATAHAWKENVTRLTALRDIVAGFAGKRLVGEMMETAAREPALRNRWGCDVWIGGVAGDFVAIGASVK
jgi:hypothetical protein